MTRNDGNACVAEIICRLGGLIARHDGVFDQQRAVLGGHAAVFFDLDPANGAVSQLHLHVAAHGKVPDLLEVLDGAAGVRRAEIIQNDLQQIVPLVRDLDIAGIRLFARSDDVPRAAASRQREKADLIGLTVLRHRGHRQVFGDDPDLVRRIVAAVFIAAAGLPRYMDKRIRIGMHVVVIACKSDCVPAVAGRDRRPRVGRQRHRGQKAQRHAEHDHEGQEAYRSFAPNTCLHQREPPRLI